VYGHKVARRDTHLKHADVFVLEKEPVVAMGGN
jgi:hypothetical protein